MSSDSSSIEEQVDKLDILTINAERRAYMLHFLNNSESPVPGCRSARPSIDLESPSGSIRLSNGGSSTNSSPASSVNGSHRSVFSLKFFRKRRRHSGGGNSGNRGGSDSVSQSSSGGEDSLVEEVITSEMLKKVTVGQLPQLFLAKYLGCITCQGLKGVNAIRGPVDRLVEAVGRLKAGQDLPLVTIVFSKSGVRADNHYLSKGAPIAQLLISIEDISYGVQDVKFCRVFAMIIVKEISNQKVMRAECHAFMCPNPVIARRLSLCVGLAYQSMARRIAGKEVYSMDLRSPSEVVQEQMHSRNEVDV